MLGVPIDGISDQLVQPRRVDLTRCLKASQPMRIPHHLVQINTLHPKAFFEVFLLPRG